MGTLLSEKRKWKRSEPGRLARGLIRLFEKSRGRKVKRAACEGRTKKLTHKQLVEPLNELRGLADRKRGVNP